MLRTTLTTLCLTLLLTACGGGGTAGAGGTGGSGGGGGGGGNGGGQSDPGYFLKVYPPSTAYTTSLFGNVWKRYRLSQPEANTIRIDYLDYSGNLIKETNRSITPYVLDLRGKTLMKDEPFVVTVADEIPQAWFDDGRMNYSRVAVGRYFESAGLQPTAAPSSFTLTGREVLTGTTPATRKMHSYSVETVNLFGVVYGEGTMGLKDGTFLSAYASNDRLKVTDTNIDRLIFEWVGTGLTKTTRTRTVIQTSGFQQGSDMSFLEMPDGSVIVTRTYRTNRTFRLPLGQTGYYFDAHVFKLGNAANNRRLEWQTKLPSIHYYDLVTSLRLAQNGNIMLAYGGSKLVANALATRIVELNPFGKIVAQNRLQITEAHVIYDFLPLKDGEILLVGAMRSAVHNNEESLFIGRLDKDLSIPDPNQN